MKLRDVIPFRRCRLETSLSADECHGRLAAVVRRTKPFTILPQPNTQDFSCMFEGRVSSERFSLSRIIHYRNSFLPVIQGQFEPFSAGTRIKLTLRLHAAVAVFVACWLGVVGGLAFTVTTRWLTMGRFDAGVPVLWLMFAAGYGLMIGGFAVEAQKAQAALSDLFAADVRPV